MEKLTVAEKFTNFCAMIKVLATTNGRQMNNNGTKLATEGEQILNEFETAMDSWLKKYAQTFRSPAQH
jgi:hypothetical protein